MVPVLFEIGGVKIYSHGFFFLFGLLAGLALLLLEAKRRRWPKEEVIPITLAAFVGGMIGARLSILFFNGWETAPLVLNFYALFDPRIGPGSILGGVVGAYAGGYIAAKAIGKAGCACDAFAPAMALATAIGRIGDFLAAEDLLVAEGQVKSGDVIVLTIGEPMGKSGGTNTMKIVKVGEHRA